MRTIELNSDLGESFGNWKLGNDAALIPEIGAANVACGFHASDPLTMVETVRLCLASGVAVGAHPGLPDLLGFGRRAMKISAEECYAYVLYQAGALQGILAAAGGGPLHHLKPHGAFYSILRDEDALAEAFCAAAAKAMDRPVVYWPGPAGASLPRYAEQAGIRVVHEVYVDMDYTPDGALRVSRAVHQTDVAQVCDRIREWIATGSVMAEDGTPVPVEAQSICIHGDGPNAVEIAQALKQTIKDAGLSVSAVAA
jgi:UPF0271 protein